VKSGAKSPGSSASVDRGVTAKIMIVRIADVAFKIMLPPYEITFTVFCKVIFAFAFTLGS
jgi:hypothetical protein